VFGVKPPFLVRRLGYPLDWLLIKRPRKSGDGSRSDRRSLRLVPRFGVGGGCSTVQNKCPQSRDTLFDVKPPFLARGCSCPLLLIKRPRKSGARSRSDRCSLRLVLRFGAAGAGLRSRIRVPCPEIRCSGSSPLFCPCARAVLLITRCCCAVLFQDTTKCKLHKGIKCKITAEMAWLPRRSSTKSGRYPVELSARLSGLTIASVVACSVIHSGLDRSEHCSARLFPARKGSPSLSTHPCF